MKNCQLLDSAKELRATETMQNDALSDIDNQIKQLEKKRSKLLEEKKKTLSEKAKTDDEKRNLKQKITQLKINHEEKNKSLEKDIDKLKEKLFNAKIKLSPEAKTKPAPAPEPMVVVDTRLEEFISRQVAALEEELECPVCLEVLTTSPIYKCSSDHLICPECRPRVARCPQCRETFPRGEPTRFRGAERQAERLKNLYEESKRLLK